jgi:cytochrome P450 family 619
LAISISSQEQALTLSTLTGHQSWFLLLTSARFTEWAQRYGGIFSLKFGSGTTVVLTDRRIIRELMDKRSAKTSHRPPAYVLRHLVNEGDYVLTQDTTPDWRKMRKVITQEFSESMCDKEHVQLQNAEAIQMMRDLALDEERYMLHPKRYSNSFILAVRESAGLLIDSFPPAD